MTKLKAFSPCPSLMAGVKTARDPCCHLPAVPQSPVPSQQSAVQHLPSAERAWSPDLCPHHSFPTGGRKMLLVGCSPTFPAHPGLPRRLRVQFCSPGAGATGRASQALEDSARGRLAAGSQVAQSWTTTSHGLPAPDLKQRSPGENVQRANRRHGSNLSVH